jgi:hypothetical protein
MNGDPFLCPAAIARMLPGFCPSGCNPIFMFRLTYLKAETVFAPDMSAGAYHFQIALSMHHRFTVS